MSVQLPRTSTGSQLFNKKYRNSLLNGRYSNNTSFKSQQIHPNRTMRLQKLKSQLTQYLNKKIVTKNEELGIFQGNVINSSPINQLVQGKRQKKSVSQQGKYHKNVNPIAFNKTTNLYLQKKQRREKKNIERKESKSAQENVEQITKTSFMIKQIKPTEKDNGMMTKNHKVHTPGVGKIFGSYYQIVALQKKFENSKYFWRENGSKFIGSRSPYLQEKYRSRISNPQHQNRIIFNPSKNIHRAKQKQDGTNIEPWKNMEQSIIHDF